MNCQQIDKYLYEYCDNNLNPLLRAEFDQHLKHCASCQSLVNEAMWEGTILRQEWSIPALPDDFTDKVMNRIANSSFKEPLTPHSHVSITNKKYISGWKAMVLAMAAIFLLAFNIQAVKDNPRTKIDNQGQSPIAYTDTSNTDTANNSKRLLENQELRKKSSITEEKNTTTPDKPNINVSSSNKTSDGNMADSSASSMDSVLMMSQAAATPAVLSVQPANLPSSYILLTMTEGDGNTTYTYGKGEKDDKLIINIAQLPPNQQNLLPYSRGQKVDSQKSATLENTAEDATSAQSSTLLQDKEQPVEDLAGLDDNKEQSQAEPTCQEPNSIAFEIKHNNQRYWVTIKANLSPEELIILSQNLKLINIDEGNNNPLH